MPAEKWVGVSRDQDAKRIKAVEGRGIQAGQAAYRALIRKGIPYNMPNQVIIRTAVGPYNQIVDGFLLNEVK
jgi:hypothetical protein